MNTKRLTCSLLALVLLIMAIPWALLGCELQPVYAAGQTTTTADIQAVIDDIQDQEAKDELQKALDEGAEIQLTYTADGRVASYKIIREGVSKKHEDMTEEEKSQALTLLIQQGIVANRIVVDGTTYSLNQTLWKERGIIVYGDTKEINNKVSVTSGANYKDGQYRYWGYDINGGLYGNDDFPRDSDSGTPAYEKDWLTTEEIRESSIARSYIGEHGLSSNSRYTTAEKQATANQWLKEHPEWKSAGLDVSYILNHFYFNSVLSDSGLTNGQFTGVHLSRQSGTLYYQSFSVQGEIPTFLVTEGTVKERVLIDDPTVPEPEEPEIPSDISVEVELGAPSTTYVGHPTTLTDRSTFTVNGQVQSATRVYADNLASNRFKLPGGGGTIKKSSSVPTRAEATFNTPGTHTAQLAVTPKGGSGRSDSATIQVLDVPAIGHSLTGTQKQNRKQVLTLWVATHPERPLTRLWIRLSDTVTGETVTLEHHVGDEKGTENTLQNGDVIKTRPIQGLESDKLFTNCQLEFLTKNNEERTFTYTVYAEDSSGKTDQVTVEFVVAPDLAPEPKIDAEATYIREEGKNRAKITVSDETVTDGDQLERTWSLVPVESDGTPSAITNYEDLSFGSGKTVAFDKEGVGQFEIQLRVKDVWTEPTLEEYVTEADHHRGETSTTGDVINIAPKISLEPVDTKKGNFLFLTTSGGVLESIQNQLGTVRSMLLERGIDATLTADQILPTETSETYPWTKTLEVNTAFGYQGSWTSLYEQNNFVADNKRLYKIDATWLGSEMDYYPQAPYTITAWDGETGEVDWTYTFTSEVLSVPNSGPYFAQDDTGTYLYFVSNGQTLILDKATGTCLTKLAFAVGTNCFVGEEAIYTVKSDGIYAIHTGSGRVSKVYAGTVCGEGARYGGGLQCVIRMGEMLYRGTMELTTGQMKLQPLEGTIVQTASYTAERFCTDGTLLIKETNGTAIKFILYDDQGKIVASQSRSAENMDGVAVRNGAGNVDYVAYTVNAKSGTTYKTTLTCVNLRTGSAASTSLSNANGYPAEARIIAAEQAGDTVYVVVGGYITWIANYGWGNGPTHGYPQRTRTGKFDMSVPSGSIVANSTIALDDMKEYGRSSEVYAVIQSGQNGQYQSPPSGNITTLYRRGQTLEEAEQRLKNKYMDDSGAYDLQKTFVLTEADLKEEALAQLVDRQLDYEDMNHISYVELASDGEEAGSLSRTVSLEPDTTYYYEYDLYQPGGSEPTDIFFADADLSRVSEDHLTGLQYRVNKTFRCEDMAVTAVGEKSRIRTASASQTFTVEEGTQAVLSFDFAIAKYSAAGRLADYVLVDGVRWKMPFNGSANHSGHYTHPYLLEQGEHTVQIVARTCGSRNSTVSIENITVEYVEEQAPDLTLDHPELIQGNQNRNESMGEGWTRVKGSFTTPGTTVAYEGLEGTVQKETAGEGGFTSKSMPSTRITDLHISVPTSQTAIYTSVQTTSKPLLKGTKYYSVQWNVDGQLYHAYIDGYWDTHEEERITTYNLPHSHDFVLSNILNPAVEMVVKGSTSNGYSSGTMGDVVLASVVQTDASTINRRFFLQMPTETQEGAILSPNLQFNNAATIGFRTNPSREVGIANLRIYSVENGIRVYVTEEDITDTMELERWTSDNVESKVIADGQPMEVPKSLVYAKGELVKMDVNYWDHEGDPSKASYWTYTHEPFNDGLHPQSGQTLSEPIERFYVDGKYIAEHYQEDSTGDPTYDKPSNIETIVFYIEGGASAPWIKSIVTDPYVVEEGSDFRIKVAVDDLEKDPLNLNVEVYKEGKRLFQQTFTNLTANGLGNYPIQITDVIQNPSAGTYEVICTVSDETGTGIHSQQFMVRQVGRIEGTVAHTEAWDGHRRTYNTTLFGTKATLYNTPMTLGEYLSYPTPRPRGSNVFWAGEELILTAEVGGNPTSVIAEADGYSVRLVNTGQKTEDNETIYKGSLWSSTMRTAWGTEPEEITVTFKAFYGEGNVKEYKVNIIMDSNTEYWLLHRYK